MTGSADPESGTERPAPAATPGARLRAARERRGLSVGEVAETLHVVPNVISALEDDQFGVFDAPVYARGFLRKYGSYLDLPAAELVAGYDAMSAGPHVPNLIPAMNVAPPARRLEALKLPALLVLALAFVAGSYWWWATRGPTRGAPPVAAAPAGESPTARGATDVALAPDATGGARGPAAGDPPATAPLPAAAEPAAALPAASPPATSDERPRAEAGPAAVAAAAPRPRPESAGAGLTVRGIRDCWVEIHDPSGARVLYDLVRAGETRAVPGAGPWRVFLGVADGARLSIGGRTVVVPASRHAGVTARFVVAGDGAVQ